MILFFFYWKGNPFFFKQSKRFLNLEKAPLMFLKKMGILFFLLVGKCSGKCRGKLASQKQDLLREKVISDLLVPVLRRFLVEFESKISVPS